MPLHTDYRPQTFAEMIGNENTIKVLQQKLQQKDKPHSFLFHGPSGCGKTTLARLLAHELGCEEGFGLIEINASNNRGIDTARSIIDSLPMAPLQGKCKGYLIDEAHKATSEFQNAMLKPLEDAPDHVFFFLCTTEPNKILPTVRNRCHMFEVQRLRDKQMEQLINWVLESEGADFGKEQKEVMAEIIDVADGCPRQALIILDRIIDLPPQEMKGAVGTAITDEKQVDALCRSLLKGENWNRVSAILKAMDQNDPEKIRMKVLMYFGKVLLDNDDPRAAIILELFETSTYMTGGFPSIVKACYLAASAGK